MNMPREPKRLGLLLTGLHVAGVLALLALGVFNLRTYCENFGCIGVGVLWFAWCVLYSAVLLVGAFAARAARGASSPRRLRQTARGSMAAQLLIGVLAVAYWLLR